MNTVKLTYVFGWVCTYVPYVLRSYPPATTNHCDKFTLMDTIVNNSSDFDEMEDESGSFSDFMMGIENDMLNLMKETAKGRLMMMMMMMMMMMIYFCYTLSLFY